MCPKSELKRAEMKVDRQQRNRKSGHMRYYRRQNTPWTQCEGSPTYKMTSFIVQKNVALRERAFKLNKISCNPKTAQQERTEVKVQYCSIVHVHCFDQLHYLTSAFEESPQHITHTVHKATDTKFKQVG